MSVHLTCGDVARAVWGEPPKREGAELLYRCPHPEGYKNGDSPENRPEESRGHLAAGV